MRPLVVTTGESSDTTRDWLQMSLKHKIDVNRNSAHLSICGGKLTDCINVGNEIASIVSAMGVNLSFPEYKWYGEPHPLSLIHI